MLLCVIFCPQFCCVFAIMHINLFRDGTGGNVVKELSDFKKTEIFSGSGRRTDENFYDTDWIDADIYITDYINKLELSEKNGNE